MPSALPRMKVVEIQVRGDRLPQKCMVFERANPSRRAENPKTRIPKTLNERRSQARGQTRANFQRFRWRNWAARKCGSPAERPAASSPRQQAYDSKGGKRKRAASTEAARVVDERLVSAMPYARRRLNRSATPARARAPVAGSGTPGVPEGTVSAQFAPLYVEPMSVTPSVIPFFTTFSAFSS